MDDSDDNHPQLSRGFIRMYLFSLGTPNAEHESDLLERLGSLQLAGRVEVFESFGNALRHGLLAFTYLCPGNVSKALEAE